MSTPDKTFGNYIVTAVQGELVVRDAKSTERLLEGSVVRGPSGVERTIEVIGIFRSDAAACFFARAAAGASPDELKKDPFMAPQPVLEAPEPIITEGQKF